MKLVAACLAAATALAPFPMAVAAEIAPADVKYDGATITTSLTGTPGNPEEGAKVLANRSLGNCLACHVVTPLAKEQFHGDVAPSLDGVADRWSAEQLRGIVVNAKHSLNPDSVMPGFYTLEVGINVRKDLVGKTILTAQQVEDVVAYLVTLKDAK
ncbi:MULTISPECIES: sulfur oxidation c-type cytochrome SoxX [Alphaproteobacteria]|uniref:Sulfur oxidation c-type cytochrome SoxX n=2 Tax=Alphaproteobacteria TaxID=28211 RepID=A0A512HIQ0_9HYPH|nr:MULTISPECIES: sulfur oxidation c-type cytochrome SoxX [Alphaproteobacteria]GEO85270.1 sulfur oxidation c-type cytochrome SoxX [Ciceribacter naphthalenivorans]GLR20909.1 sulfur oxidation c-type cytochrome SoxX [Ciceribacter naphthalenivorans]GLT03765.1 sulfur oxidation c-type cytochrome SoxX [Sphingomonas psychrolutea]